MKLKLIRAFLGAILIGILGLTSSALAVTLTYETLAGDGGPGAGFLYSLTYDYQGDFNNFKNFFATFTIETPGGNFTEGWWAGWFTFKLVPGENAANLSNLSAPNGSWITIPPTTNVYGGINIGQGGRSGFYEDSLSDSGLNYNNFPYGDLISLTDDDPKSYTFTFNFSTNDIVFTDEIPFQVGYYDGATGNNRVITNRLSQSVSVPEPSTLLLLGAGLVGLGIVGRKRKK